MSPDPSGAPRGSRLRFETLDGVPLSNSRYRVRIRLTGPDGSEWEAESEETDLAEGRMRAGAEATLRAILPLVEDRISFQFRGAKTVRAFDTYVVVVALHAGAVEGSPLWSDGRPGRYLVGCVSIPDRDLARGAALAVLNAVNRILERPEFSSREPSQREAPSSKA
jgi:hypothetical protein